MGVATLLALRLGELDSCRIFCAFINGDRGGPVVEPRDEVLGSLDMEGISKEDTVVSVVVVIPRRRELLTGLLGGGRSKEPVGLGSEDIVGAIAGTDLLRLEDSALLVSPPPSVPRSMDLLG